MPTAAALKQLYSPTDFDFAHEQLNAMCGHGALAAALGVSVGAAMNFFTKTGWVNIPTMESAIRVAGIVPCRLVGWDDARPMVTIIQWLGPWMNPGVPPSAQCRHRHWVASNQRLVWDVNSERWQTREEWEREIVPRLLPPRSTGWLAFRSLLLR